MDTHSDDFEANSVAIVGLAGRFPAASSVAELWALLRDGKEATQWLTEDELRAAGVSEADLHDPDYVRASLVLPKMEQFDAEFFGFSKRDASILDPQHRHFLECAWEALEDAGHPPETFGGAIGVFGGCGMQAYLPYNLLTNPKLVKSVGLFLLRHTGNDKDFLTSRLSYLLGLTGPSITIQTACSTSLVAVHVAAQSLLSGECDMALAGGVSIELPHRRGYHYAEGEILSPDGHCRAFDDNAKGTVFGSGAAIVVLRRLEDAVKDRDNIYAVIRGSAVNNDGSAKAGYLAPSVDGQARAAVEALAVAGVEAASVSYIEAHGTGTPVGDPIEVAALTQAYGSGGQGFCGIGSLKTNIGHLDTAAGAAALIKVALALRHGLIPASLNFSQPNSRFDMAKTPFRVVDQPTPWRRETGSGPRRAAVNSLGVGGTNAHVIVEEPPVLGSASAEAGWQVVALSARSAASLENLKAKWRDFLAQPPAGFTLADAAYTTQVGRKSFEHRCAIVATDVAGLSAALASKNHARCVTGKAIAQRPGVALMFPGGGAQYPGVGRELLSQPAFRQAVEECFSVMPAAAPADLRSIMFESDAGDAAAASALEQPTQALLSLFVLEYALAKLWKSWGITPSAVIGHSAGEYAAACFAGVMSVADALSVVLLRGQLFEAAPPGSMVSVDLPETELRALMSGLDLDIAAVNAPDLCMASGPLHAIATLEQRLSAQRLEGRRLRINVAAHSHLLDGVLSTFRERVSRIRLSQPTIPFISNLTGSWADAQMLTDPEYWVRHLRSPVRFSEGLRKLFELPDTLLVEAGPGQGLCALARHNSAGQPPRTILPSTCKAQEAGADLAQMLTTAGALWTRGAVPKWEALRGPSQTRRISLPTYAFDHQRHWIEAGTGLQESPAPSQQAAAPAPPPGPPAIHRLPSYDDWFLVPQWHPAPLAAVAPRSGRHWLVFDNDSQLGADLVVQAEAQGGQVTRVRRGQSFARLADGSFALEPADATHYRRLFEMLEQAAMLPDSIVHLWALDTRAGSQDQDRRLAGQTLAFDSLVYVAQALQTLALDQPMQLSVLSAASQSVLGEAPTHPEGALALGPVRVIARELPNVSTRLIDLDGITSASVTAPPQALVRALLAECQSADPSDLVAYRAGQRWTQQLANASAAPPSGPQLSLRHGGVYLITGGLGDIALDLATFLASTKQARLALVSRRRLPPASSWRTLAASSDGSLETQIVRRLVACEDAGAQILALSADAADRAAMTQAVSACQAHFGKIHGVFHAAGALDDGPIATKSPDSLQRVLNSKALGAQLLHELLPPGELDVFAVFSSTSVYLGPPGQVDYVAANAFLDALAASRPDGLSLHWGIWGDQGMAARAHGGRGATQHLQTTLHPLLGVQVSGEQGATFEATYTPKALWVLHEHSVAGRLILPGSAYIEIARAAMAQLHPGEAIEINALSFEAAMVFDGPAGRLVSIGLQRSGEAYEFLVRSRATPDQPWLENARARVSVFLGRLAAAAPPASGAWRTGEIPQAPRIAFGARWSNIARMQLAEHNAVAEMELAESFAGDLATYTVHPAILDMAATFGLHLIDESERSQNLFVPLSIERIRLVAPLPRCSISRVALKARQKNRFATFDVSLHATDGSPIASLEGVCLRGVTPEQVLLPTREKAAREPSLIETMLSCGIRAEDSQALFSRIFSNGHRDLVVSSISLVDLKRAMNEALPKAPARRAEGSGAAPGDSALNPVEVGIAEVWRELLGVEDISGDDDFFALGGHSLAAVRLFARIRKQFAVDLPLATLFEAPTLSSLAAIVAHRSGISTTPQSGAEPHQASSNVIALVERAWSPLVAICQGRPDRQPLFCVHGAGGNVLNFKVISDRLGPALPFYGLQAQGVDGRLPVLQTIEAMASQYIEAIRSVDPHGPYRLVGYSGGGLIAFEMAQQLKRAGAEIALLAMIDTLSPSAVGLSPPLLKRLWLIRHWSVKFAMERPERRRKGKLMEINYTLALEKLARGESLPPELVGFHLFRNFVAAQQRYQPQPYAGPLVLFRAVEADTQYLAAGNRLGWEQHIVGPVSVTAIAGSHFSMMAEPGVSQLTEALGKELVALDEHSEHPHSRAA